MRISILKDDPGYRHHDTNCFEVYLDGERIDHVITADEEKGEILRFQTTPAGKLFLDGTEVARETRTGKVELRFRGGDFGNPLRP